VEPFAGQLFERCFFENADGSHYHPEYSRFIIEELQEAPIVQKKETKLKAPKIKITAPPKKTKIKKPKRGPSLF
jgi:hypothetical protein